MEVFHRAALLTPEIVKLRESGKTIGFVPTMGALHDGHLSLVRICKKQNDTTVASIFVNPNQFNDRNDLKKYPRMPERDKKLLRSEGCDIVFLPEEEEIYPEPDTRQFDFGGLDLLMEGKHRPGHFNGVAQVVTKLFSIVTPHRAYFGLKDYQQVAIIRRVTRDLHFPVEIISCPIIRECDGLAMSSRNMLLGTEERKTARVLSQALFRAKEMKEFHTPAEVRKYVTDQINAMPGIELEYFEIIGGRDLVPVASWKGKDDVIGCLAAKVGKVRLIDNINFSS